MSYENSLNFVRAIKGASASILVALLIARRPMTSQELQRWTGYPEDRISQATRRLVELGWVSAPGARGPWILSRGRRMLLMERSNASGVRSPTVPLAAGSPASGFNGEDGTQGETMDPDAKEEEGFVRALYALFDAGIREPTAGRLARLPHVTPQYVAAHVALANAQGFRLGVAIYRMEHGWPMPRTKAVLTVEDRIRKFLDDP
jgi:hypothetical protein